MTDGSNSPQQHEETSRSESAEPPSNLDGAGNID
jgi:hypothetical protein